MIRIINLKNYALYDNEILIRIDRTTPLGNPFIMKDESQRNYVCDQYYEYFYNKIKNNHPNIMMELNRILSIAKKFDICLGCWCKQDNQEVRCHGDTIKEYLDWQLTQ